MVRTEVLTICSPHTKLWQIIVLLQMPTTTLQSYRCSPFQCYQTLNLECMLPIQVGMQPLKPISLQSEQFSYYQLYKNCVKIDATSSVSHRVHSKLAQYLIFTFTKVIVSSISKVKCLVYCKELPIRTSAPYAIAIEQFLVWYASFRFR